MFLCGCDLNGKIIFFIDSIVARQFLFLVDLDYLQKAQNTKDPK